MINLLKRFWREPTHTKVYRNRALENFCGVAVEAPKLHGNIGVLFRTAAVVGNVDFLATVGARYDKNNHWDPSDAHRILPTWHFDHFADLRTRMPLCSVLVGVELTHDAVPLEQFEHPDRAVYLFGSEDAGLSQQARRSCRYTIKLPSATGTSINLSSAGSIVLWDRYVKTRSKHEQQANMATDRS